MLPVVEAAQALVDSLEPWLHAELTTDPFEQHTYPTLPLDKKSFTALGRLLLALRVFSTNAPIMGPSDVKIGEQITALLTTKWAEFTHIEGPAIMPWAFEMTPNESWRPWLATIYFDQDEMYIGVRGWVNPAGTPIITHFGKLKSQKWTFT